MNTPLIQPLNAITSSPSFRGNADNQGKDFRTLTRVIESHTKSTIMGSWYGVGAEKETNFRSGEIKNSGWFVIRDFKVLPDGSFGFQLRNIHILQFSFDQYFAKNSFFL